MNAEDTLLVRLKRVSAVAELPPLLSDLNSSPSIRQPSSFSMQILLQLLNATIPEYYHALKADKRDGGIMHCRSIFSSVNGLGAIVSVIGTRSAQVRSRPRDETERGKLLVLLELLNDIVRPGVISVLASQLRESDKEVLYWQEGSSLFAGSKILGYVGDAYNALNQSGEFANWKWAWMADGKKFTAFLAGEVVKAYNGNVTELARLAKFMSRSMDLGYPGMPSLSIIFVMIYLLYIDHFMRKLIEKDNFYAATDLSSALPSVDRMTFTKILLHYLQSTYLDRLNSQEADAITRRIEALGMILVQLVPPSQEDHLLKLVQAGAGQLFLRRAVVCWLVFHGM